MGYWCGGGVNHKAAILETADVEIHFTTYAGEWVNLCRKAVEVLHHAMKICCVHHISQPGIMRHATYDDKYYIATRARCELEMGCPLGTRIDWPPFLDWLCRTRCLRAQVGKDKDEFAAWLHA